MNMKAITIRNLRQPWPKTERILQAKKEFVIMRDGEPVARLVRIIPEPPPQKRWHPEAHKQWLNKTWPSQPLRLTDKYLLADREDRKLSGSNFSLI